MENVRLHRRGGADAHECTKFGDIVTVDTMVLHGLKDRGVNGETDAVVFYDLATKYIDVLPVFSRSVPNTVEAFHKFMGPEPKIGLLPGPSQRISCGYSPNGLGASHVHTRNANDEWHH